MFPTGKNMRYEINYIHFAVKRRVHVNFQLIQFILFPLKGGRHPYIYVGHP